MNTMMQASLHQSVGEDISDLMKNNDDPLFIDPYDEGDDLFDDDFNADELLQSPLFNDSAKDVPRINTNLQREAMFIDYRIDDPLMGNMKLGGGGVGTASIISENSAEFSATSACSSQTDDFMIMNNNNNINNHHTTNQLYAGLSNMSNGSSPMQAAASRMMCGMPKHSMSMASNTSPSMMMNNTTTSPMKMNSPNLTLAQMQQAMSRSAASAYDQQQQHQPMDMDTCMHPGAGGVDTLLGGMNSMGGGSMHEFQQQQQQQRSAPMRSVPTRSSSQSSAIPYRMPPERSNSYTPQLSSMNMLQNMQQQMQLKRANNTINTMGLSQSMHTSSCNNTATTNGVGSPLRSASHHSAMMNNLSSRPNNLLGSASFHGPSTSTFSSFNTNSNHNSTNINNNNVASIPSDGMSDPPGTGLNEAMEKLCESMKRSAMSRSLVKQFSTRSSTGVTRQNSGRMVHRQLSATTNTNTGLDNGSGRGTPTLAAMAAAVPIRRVSQTKHHLQHPVVRGVLRHDSQQSLNGASNHGINLHIDGRNLGTF
jgi:hypothetical protein